MTIKNAFDNEGLITYQIIEGQEKYKFLDKLLKRNISNRKLMISIYPAYGKNFQIFD